jgi:hypothetical protein
MDRQRVPVGDAGLEENRPDSAGDQAVERAGPRQQLQP